VAKAEADAEKAAAQDRADSEVFNKNRRAEVEAIVSADRLAMETAQQNVLNRRSI